MAARKSSSLSPRHREAIRTSMLINRLQRHVEAGADGEAVKPGVLMSHEQVRAALGLLKKTLPDLLAVDVAPGTNTGFLIMGQPEAKDAEAWQDQHRPQTGE